MANSLKKQFKIKNHEIVQLLGAEPTNFPKYSTQIINLANQNSQGTRPTVVGQMSELIQEFSGTSIEEWENWYLTKHPDAIKQATKRIAKMIENLKGVIDFIDEDLIENWVRDLVIVKTFIGLRFQAAILEKVAQILNVEYRIATAEEEAMGIDGFVGNQPVSIKPETYNIKKALPEQIISGTIYYKKGKDGLIVNIESLL